MNPSTPSLSDFAGRLVTLCDGRAGLRGALPVEVQNAAGPAAAGQGQSRPIIDFIASSETLDRFDEILTAGGWQLDHYRRNPVFQNAHQYGDIIFTLGKALITEVRSGASLAASDGERGPHYLYQRVEFATEVNPMARIAYGLYRGKFLNAVSVGFIPLRWENGDGTIHTLRQARPTAQGKGAPSSALDAVLDPPRILNSQSPVPHSAVRTPHFRRRYLEQELLEVSAVGMPANPEALQLGLRAGVIEKADLQELLDLLQGLIGTLPRSSGAEPANPGFPFCSPTAATDLLSGAFEVRGNEAQWLQLARELRQVLGPPGRSTHRLVRAQSNS